MANPFLSHYDFKMKRDPLFYIRIFFVPFKGTLPQVIEQSLFLFFPTKVDFPNKKGGRKKEAPSTMLSQSPPPPPFHPNVHTDALKRREGRLTMMSPEREEIKGPHAGGRGLLLQTHTYVLYWRQRYRHGWGGGPFYIPRCGFSQRRNRNGKGQKKASIYLVKVPRCRRLLFLLHLLFLSRGALPTVMMRD